MIHWIWKERGIFELLCCSHQLRGTIYLDFLWVYLYQFWDTFLILLQKSMKTRYLTLAIGLSLFFLSISSSWINLRLHTENKLYTLPGSALTICVVGGVECEFSDQLWLRPSRTIVVESSKWRPPSAFWVNILLNLDFYHYSWYFLMPF